MVRKVLIFLAPDDRSPAQQPQNSNITKLPSIAKNAFGHERLPIFGDLITQDVRMLWLRMLEEGGWWELKMLEYGWKPTCCPQDIRHAMDALEAVGLAESRDQFTNLSYRAIAWFESISDG